MKQGICLFCLFTLLLFSLNSFAQDRDNLISGNFHEITFHEFVEKVEAQTDFHFYYDASQFDSLTITIAVSKAHLQAVLTKFSTTPNGIIP